MKLRLLVFALLILTTSDAIAQDKKPTKEETINFLKKTLKGSIYAGFTLTEIEINDDSLSTKEVC